MAYMSQERKKELAPGIKAVLKKYGVKGSIGVRNHSHLVVNITEGPIDFRQQWLSEEPPEYYRPEKHAEWYDYLKRQIDNGGLSINTYHIERNWEGECQKFLLELHEAMNGGNHDDSDIMTDYFNVGWYTDINIGKWEKPYKLTV